MHEMRHETVESVLERVRPCLRVDGGDVELVSVEDGVVTLRIIGGFSGCPMSQIALHCGLEHALTREVEGITKVVLLRGAEAGRVASRSSTPATEAVAVAAVAGSRASR